MFGRIVNPVDCLNKPRIAAIRCEIGSMAAMITKLNFQVMQTENEGVRFYLANNIDTAITAFYKFIHAS